MAPQFLTRTCVLTIVISIGLSASSFAQSQKYDDPYQKGYPWQKGSPPLNEEDQRQQDQGGYQAPPPTGAMEGPTREFGLSTGEIELPAIRLRLPRIRFPSLSMFLTPPRMHTERGVAPMVQQIQNQISVPTASPPPSEDQTAPEGKNWPTQKEHYGHNAMQQDTASEAVEFAQIRGEMEEFEHRLDQRLALLASSIEQLVEQKERDIQKRRSEALSTSLVPLPLVDDVERSAVRQSSYLTTRPMTPTPSAHNELQRLPTTTQKANPLVNATQLRRLPTLADGSPVNR